MPEVSAVLSTGRGTRTGADPCAERFSPFDRNRGRGYHPPTMRRDLILSSGFLAFARHVGFLVAVEEAGVEVEAVCGTSSGALVAALWAAGMPAERIGEELSGRPPIRWMRPSLTPWRGLFRIEPVVARLRQLLPATFAELRRPLGARAPWTAPAPIICSPPAPLPEAVAASCAIPNDLPAGDARRAAALGRRGRRSRSGWPAGANGGRAAPVWSTGSREPGVQSRRRSSTGLEIVRTPPSGASFFDLKEFDAQVEEAKGLTASGCAGRRCGACIRPAAESRPERAAAPPDRVAPAGISSRSLLSSPIKAHLGKPRVATPRVLESLKTAELPKADRRRSR